MTVRIALLRESVPSSSGLERAIALCAVMLTALLWLGVVERIHFERSGAEGVAREQTMNLAIAAEQHAINTFDDVKQTLALVVREFDRHRSAPRLQEIFDEGAIASGLYHRLTVADERGDIVAGSTVFPTAVNVADRDYFQFHRTHRGADIFVGRAVVGRVGGEWIVPVTQRIDAADGTFMGVAIASLQPSYFSAFYHKLQVGEHGFVTLLGRDGFTRAMRRGDNVLQDFDLRRASLWARLAGEPSATYLTTRPVDGVNRYVSYRALAGLPLVVAVGFPQHDVLAAFEERRLTYLLTAAAGTVVLVLVAIGFLAAARLQWRAQQQILREEARFRGTFEQALVGISYADLDGRYLAANRAFLRMHGYTEAELRNRTFADLTHPDDRERADALRKSMFDRGQDQSALPFEKRNVRKDGSCLWVSITTTLVHDTDGEPEYFATIVEDVTRAREATDELRESNRRFSDMLEHLELIAITADTSGRITYCNDYFLRLTGWSRHEVIGRGLVEVLRPPDGPGVRDVFDRVLANARDARHYDNEICTRSGERRLVRWNNSVLRSSSGEVIGAAGIGEDITELRRAEMDRIRSQQLEIANRLKSEFLANMSHELRTPLNSIIGFAEVLRDGLAGDLSTEQHEYTGHIVASGEHLLALINEILDLSKIEAGRMDLVLEETCVAALVDASLTVVREKALAHRIRLSASIETREDTLQLDVRRAKQILYNLLSNAVKFTPDGGSVRVTAREVSAAEVPDAKFDRYLEIAVRDTGIGIAREDLPKLFQPFTQIDSSLARRHEGTGLGLSLVKRLVHLHGGAVAVTSRLGEGSTFRVWLPWRCEPPLCSHDDPATIRAGAASEERLESLH